MVEDVGLNLFIPVPYLFRKEEIYFYRQSELSGFPLGDYYVEILNHKDVEYIPSKLPMPNLEIDILSMKSEWENILLTGKGSIRLAPRMTIKNNVITITALPAGKNIEHIRKIIDKEIIQDKVDIRDETAEKICFVVEKVPKKQSKLF